MKRGLFLAALIAAPLAGHASSSEQSSPRLLWSNAKGLVPAENCHSHAVDTVPLQVSEAVGHPRQLSHEHSSRTTLDQYIRTDLTDFVIEVKDVSDLAAKTSARLHLPLQGSFWQASMEDERYVTLVCGPQKKSYILFDVFVPNREERAARIAVNPGEMGFLTTSEIHTPDEAEAAIKSVAKTPVSFARSGGSGATTGTHGHAQETRSGQATLPRAGAVPPTPESSAKASNGTPKTKPVEPRPATKTETPAPTPEPSTESSDSESGGSDFDPVVCSSQTDIPVYDLALEKFLFYAKPLEDVRPLQTFDGGDTVARTIDGQVRNLIRAQFPERPAGQNSGWIPEDAIKQKSVCSLGAAKLRQGPGAKTRPPVATSRGFSFPMAGRPLRSFHEAPRRFRSGRKAGRLHAACDLYRPVGERIGLIADGKVIRGPYLFYEGVYAIEVQHTNGWVVRYGEVLARRAPGMRVGAQMTKGQTIGYVGWISSRKAQPMLHFELYSGHSTGPLTQKWRRGFQRRADLQDPTSLLTQWEDEKFGGSR